MKKERLPLILAIAGALVFAWNSESYIAIILGAVVYYLATKKMATLGTDVVIKFFVILVATIAVFGGGIKGLISGGWGNYDINILQAVIGCIFTWFDLFRMLGKETQTGKTLEDRYRIHCNYYEIPLYSVLFCFMTSANKKVAIGEDRVIYSNDYTSIKKLPIKHIARYELQKVEGKRLEKAVIFENNGNYHEYYFSTETCDRNNFIACLDYIMNESPREFATIEEQMTFEENTFNHLCSIGGVDTNIYPQDKVVSARMA